MSKSSKPQDVKTDVSITHTHQASSGVFAATDSGQRLGELEWSQCSAGVISFDRTSVSPSARGRGIARLLVEAGVAYARDAELQIVASCSYVRRHFDAHPACHDVDAKRAPS